MLEYLFVAFLVIFSIQFCYYIFVFSAFAFSKNKVTKNNSTPPISVIICAKNEAENLLNNVPLFLNQNYFNFELVLINDCSKDTTLDVIEQLQKEYPDKITIVNVLPNEQFWGSKKYALTLGIKASKHERMLFSDADCKPNSENWISEMACHFSEEKKIVLGYGAYEKITNSFLNKIIRFETLITAVQYFSYAIIGIPYMGVGRNLAYTKETFFSTKGFVQHIKIKSGDDDLFINEVANSKNTAICVTKESFTESIPKTSFSEWIQQKRRHISTANYYKPVHKILLGLFYSSQLLFWFVAMLLLLFLFKWEIVLILIAVKLLIQYVVIGFSAKKLEEKDLILWIPFYEIFLIFVQMLIFIKNLISKPIHW